METSKSMVHVTQILALWLILTHGRLWVQNINDYIKHTIMMHSRECSELLLQDPQMYSESWPLVMQHALTKDLHFKNLPKPPNEEEIGYPVAW
ncbi:hypothetical protein BaRGS_00001111 [Batillaria attramentaria]|uniref:Uncharacterized protein n=1 Tax=Batillaria attramentaria TaxID=370345 RepID=A0ABD0M695_9CAEN